MAWSNQPLCLSCWVVEMNDRTPVRVLYEPLEVCCMCEAVTTDGIYVRRNTDAVPFPSEKA